MDTKKVKKVALDMESIWSKWMDSKNQMPCIDFWNTLDHLLQLTLGRPSERIKKNNR